MVKFNVEATINLEKGVLRAGAISDAGSYISTPLRVLNSTELEHGHKIKSKGLGLPKFPHPVLEITKYMKPERLLEFTRNLDASATVQKQVRKISLSESGRLTIFHPVLNRMFQITDEINKKLIIMQINAEIDLISILDDYNSPLPQFKMRLKDSIKQIIDSEQYAEPMLTIRMDTDYKLFKEKIKIALEEGVKVINLTYAGVKQNYHNYSYLVELAKSKTKLWIHLSETPRRLFRKIPAMHLLPLFGIDSYALNSKPFPIGLVQIKNSPVKRFDRETVSYLTVPEHLKIYGDNPKCNCFVDKIRDKLTDVISVYQAAELLSSAITCHEAISSYYELQKLRESIIQKKTEKYLSKKKILIQPLKELLKIDLAQQKLL